MRLSDHRLHVDVLEILGERFVEIPQHLLPAKLPFLDLVQFLLHSGGELDVEYVRKPAHHDLRHRLAEFGWSKAAVGDVDIGAVTQRRDDGAVRTRPPNPQALEFLDQARLAETRRRFGEMLVRCYAKQVHTFALLESGHRGNILWVLPLLHLLRLPIEHLKAVEFHQRSGGPEQVLVDLEIDRRGVVHQRSHL